MSVCIVVKVSEGIVLGADSAATLMGRVDGPDGVQEGVLKTYYNAKKLLQIGDFPIGLCTWGQGYIGARTIESLVREWEYKNKWSSKADYSASEPFTVKSVAMGLCEFLSKAYDDDIKKNLPADMSPDSVQAPPLGAIVAGYGDNGFFPEIWRFVIPIDNEPVNQRPDRDGKPDFGASWFGLTEPIVRLHYGRDEQALQIITEKFGIPYKELHEALLPLQYPIPFPVMPLQDAIDYAHYMLSVTIGRFKFVIGPELCGGKIEIAAITQREFTWISRKSWRLGEDNVSSAPQL